MLWVNNLLLPSFIFYILYALLDQKMHPYPSLEQLREHRGHIDKASEFGEEVQARLTTTSPFGLFDTWRTLRVYKKSKVRKAKEKSKQSDDAASIMSVETAATDNDIAPVDDSAENTQGYGVRALGLEVLCELVDALERLKKCVEIAISEGCADNPTASSYGGNHPFHMCSASFVASQCCIRCVLTSHRLWRSSAS